MAMTVKRGILVAAFLALAVGLPGGPGAAAPATVEPTVFLLGQEPELRQLVRVRMAAGLFGTFTAAVASGDRRIESEVKLEKGATAFYVPAPACPDQRCPTTLELRQGGRSVLTLDFDLPFQRRWRVYLAPFSHIDVGFTNCQRKVLAQNLENLRAVLDLLDRTRDYPPEARFRFFTEVSWPLDEFMRSPEVEAKDKERMRAAVRAGQVEIGAFYISHQNKFMPAEALWRSLEPALRLGDELGATIRTGCLNDLADLSAAVRPLRAAGASYLLGGPNTSHYLTPPLFYLAPAAGRERVLVWLPPNLNGYGENVDLAMRAALPVDAAGLQAVAERLAPYLRALEESGAPPASVRAHFDFYGRSWPYPYDSYFVPFYPAHAVDNGPQDETPSELARAWNERYAYPHFILTTPGEFLAEAERRYGAQIPELRGDLAAFWGEQMFFAMGQVDPGKEAAQREYERRVLAGEARAAGDLAFGRALPSFLPDIARGFNLVALNNDHNPGPTFFGHTSYTEQDTLEWKQTRHGWIADESSIARAVDPAGPPAPAPLTGRAVAADAGDAVTLENEFYRVTVDKAYGGIRSLVDKELGRELASHDGEFLLNQYVVVARGENTGIRGSLFARPGFAAVKVVVASPGPERAAALVTGEPARFDDQLQGLVDFVKLALGVRVPARLVELLAGPLLKVKLGPVAEVSQEIYLLAGEKQVHFVQRLRVDREQAIDHTFAYPLLLSRRRPLIVEGPYNPYRFAAAPPLGDGDLIGSARMLDDDFPGINDLTWQFGWIRGLPADAVFRSYVLALDEGVGVAFSCRESGMVLPGPLRKDALYGPFGGAFYHLALGWTVYGRAFLDAPREGDYRFHSALTSFAARDEAEAKTRAARFGREFTGLARAGEVFVSNNPAVAVAAARPLEGGAVALRLYELSGEGATAGVTVPGTAAIAGAWRARLDGVAWPGSELAVKGREFEIGLGPGEAATVRVQFRAE
jgi:hypothetical protein